MLERDNFGCKSDCFLKYHYLLVIIKFVKTYLQTSSIIHYQSPINYMSTGING